MKRWMLVSGLGVAVLLAVAMPALASAAEPPGGLFQLPRPFGCIHKEIAGTCTVDADLDQVRTLAVSPNGAHVYALARVSSRVLVYDRDPATGRLTRRAGRSGCVSEEASSSRCTQVRGFHDIRDLALSPDGARLYVGSHGADAVVVLDVKQDGTLEQPPADQGCISATPSATNECRTGSAVIRVNRLTVSPDSKFVYATVGWGNGTPDDDGIAVLKATASGLSQSAVEDEGCVVNGGAGLCGDGFAMLTPSKVAITAAGTLAFLTTNASSSISAYARDVETGKLTPIAPASGGCIDNTNEDGCRTDAALANTEAILVAPGDTHLYVTSRDNRLLLTYDIAQFNSPAGGLVRRSGAAACLSGAMPPLAGCGPGRRLLDAYNLALSPDGKNLYVVSPSEHGLTAYDRAADGTLTSHAGSRGCWSLSTADACAQGDGMVGSQGVAVSPDGRFVYQSSSSAPGDNGIALFYRDLDPPVCPAHSDSTPFATVKRLTLTCSDADGHAIAYSIVEAPANGVLGQIDQATGQIDFQPSPGFTGMTSFKFKATSLGTDSDVAVFAINVTGGPPPAPVPTCTARPEIAGNGIDEDCNGADLSIVVPRVDATVRPFWTTFRSYTLLRKLQIARIPAGAKVQIRCRGRGCPFKRRTFPVRKAKADATKPFRRRRLRPGAVVEVRITAPGAIGKTVSYKILRRKVPTGVVRCLPPGATKPARC